MASIFISYCHEDKVWLKHLLTFLAGVQLSQEHKAWSDLEIGAGADWEAEIRKAMQDARIAILLISQDFLASEFIMNEELATLLDRRREEGLSVFPLIVRHSTWLAHDSLKRMQARPQDGKPLDGRTRAKREEQLSGFAKEVYDIIKPKVDAESKPTAESTGTHRGARSESAQRPARAPLAPNDRRSRESMAPRSPGPIGGAETQDSTKQGVYPPTFRPERIGTNEAARGSDGGVVVDRFSRRSP